MADLFRQIFNDWHLYLSGRITICWLMWVQALLGYAFLIAMAFLLILFGYVLDDMVKHGR